MKKIIFILSICLILFAGVFRTYAQVPTGEYYVETTLTKLQNTSPKGKGMDNINLKVRIDKWESNPIFDYWVEGYLDAGDWAWNLPRTDATTHTKRPSELLFYTERQWTENYVFWKEHKKEEFRRSLTIDRTSPYIFKKTVINGNEGNELVGVCYAPIEYTVQPKAVKFYHPDGREIKETLTLKHDRDIAIHATRGYVTSLYNWVYSIDEGGPWKQIPANLLNWNKDVATFSGTDLFPNFTDFVDFLDKSGKIQVKLKLDENATHEKKHEIIVLSPQVSAPRFVGAEVVELEKTFGSGDARVKLTFDRALYPEELLNIARNSSISPSDSNIRKLDGTHSIIVEGVEAGDNIFSVSTTVRIHKTYNGDPEHSRGLNVAHRAKVEHSTVGSRNVSCYGGSDGEITVSAKGGTDDFKAALYKDGESAPTREETFKTDENCTFSGLSHGSYEVEITDTNGGRSDDANIRVVVTQPAAPVTAFVADVTEPLAFDSRDGDVIIKVSGGTPDTSGGYGVTLTDGSGTKYSPSSNFTDNTGAAHYRFEGLGRNDYSVTVKDENNCGCESALTFTLDAPPPLVVDIEETHFINWFEGDQGELTAHAKGGIADTSGMRYTYEWYKRVQGEMQPLAMPNDSIARGLTAGVYQVKITDRNKISKTSVTYTLNQPDKLTAQFTIVETGCYGDSSGSIEAVVSGGVPPYKYQWNVEGASDKKIASLEAGTYVLKVTDSRGGILTSAEDVGSSSKLKVDEFVSQPTCVSLGSIRLSLSGAKSPYTLKWDDTPRQETIDANATVLRTDLMPGTYRVEIADAGGCRSFRTFVINELEVFTVDVGDDLVLCRGQSRTIEAVCHEPNVVYEWSLNGAKLPDTGNRIVVDKDGEYGVRVSNAYGCRAVDHMNVRITNDILELAMTVPTTIEAGSEIHAVNLSTMAADNIKWRLPEEATIIESSDTRLVFRIDREGTYTVAMEGVKGEGTSLVSREIKVVGKGKVELPDVPLIKQFWASPNPSSGYFNVVIELSRAEDFTMILYSPSGSVMDSKEAKDVKNKSYEYEIAGTQQGAYMLHLVTKSERSVLRIEIKK